RGLRRIGAAIRSGLPGPALICMPRTGCPGRLCCLVLLLPGAFDTACGLIGPDPFEHVLVDRGAASVQMDDDLAHSPDSLHAVRHEDHLRLLQTLAEDLAALLLEARVPDRHHFVDQVVVEVECHAEAERE